MRLGVLDVGSNTVHLQIMDAYIGAPPIAQSSFKVELKLTEYIDASGEITQEGLDHLIEALIKIFKQAKNLNLDETLAFATSAIREARNSDLVIKTVHEMTGIQLEILSGNDEAKFTFLAVRRWLGWSVGELLVMDIGGGSLEIARGDQEIPNQTISLQLGAGRITRNFLTGGPYSEKSLTKLENYIKAELSFKSDIFEEFTKKYAIGTSKTFRTLKRIQNHYLPELGDHLELSGLKLMVPKLQKMTITERANLPGVSSGRAAQIVAGSMVALEIMKTARVEYIQTCPWALREGIVLHRLDWIN